MPAWQTAIAALLAGAGGVDGSQEQPDYSEMNVPERKPFERPHTQQLDGFTTQRARYAPPIEQSGEPWRQYVFRNFLNEIGAGDNVASVLFDAPDKVDWGFMYDIARHGWDEYRHSMIGQQRLRDLGYDPSQFAIGTGVFEFRDRLPLLERLGMLVLVDESNAFPYKHSSHKMFQANGDDTSADYLMYDISDETRHVANGRKWIKHLQDLTGDTRSMDQLVHDMRARLQERVEYLGTGYEN